MQCHISKHERNVREGDEVLLGQCHVMQISKHVRQSDCNLCRRIPDERANLTNQCESEYHIVSAEQDDGRQDEINARELSSFE